MMKINRKLEYALMSLKYMSVKQQGELSTAKEICEQTQGPFDAVSRVLQLMAQHGVLRSSQGAQGGYMIVQDLGRITFKELIEMILGPLGIAKCVKSSNCELMDNCNIQSPIAELNRKLEGFYSKLSLKDLLELPKGHIS